MLLSTFFIKFLQYVCKMVYAQLMKLLCLMQMGVVRKFNLPYEVVGEDTKSRLRIMPSY